MRYGILAVRGGSFAWSSALRRIKGEDFSCGQLSVSHPGVACNGLKIIAHAMLLIQGQMRHGEIRQAVEAEIAIEEI